jgi:hypothetical protein
MGHVTQLQSDALPPLNGHVPGLRAGGDLQGLDRETSSLLRPLEASSSAIHMPSTGMEHG